MSQSTAVRPLPRRAPVERPRLTVVEAPLRRSTGLGFFGLCLAVGLAAMLAVLVVNTARAENSFRAGKLRAAQADLAAREGALRAELATRDDPDWIAQRAQSLGMLPGGSPAYVDAQTGAITGVATLPDSKTVFTVLAGRFADRVPPIVRNDTRAGIPGLLTPGAPATSTAAAVPPPGVAAPLPSTAPTPATPSASATAPAKPAAKPTTKTTTRKAATATRPTATTATPTSKPKSTTKG